MSARNMPIEVFEDLIKQRMFMASAGYDMNVTGIMPDTYFLIWKPTATRVMWRCGALLSRAARQLPPPPGALVVCTRALSSSGRDNRGRDNRALPPWERRKHLLPQHEQEQNAEFDELVRIMMERFNHGSAEPRLRGPKRIRSQQFCAVSNRAAEMVANSSET